MASFAKSQNITLLDYLNTLYETYGYFLEETISFEFKGMQGLDQMNDLMNHFRNAKINLPNNNTVIMQDILKKQIYNFETNKTTTSNFPPQNIIRFEYSDGSWIMARPSGTEPKLKIYYSVKGINLKDASLKLKTYQEIVNNIIKEFQ